MADEKEILLGVDLSDDYTQLSCFTSLEELYSVSICNDPQKYRIPTVLCSGSTPEEWLFGDEAVDCPPGPDRVKIDDIVALAEQNRSSIVLGVQYTADRLLGRFLEAVLNALQKKIGYTSIKYMTVTVRNLNEALRKNLTVALEQLGVPSDRLRVITHLDSFMYYAVSQNKDIWINDVGLFELRPDELVYYRLSFGRKQEPVTIVADTQHFSEFKGEMVTDEDRDSLVTEFERLTTGALHKQIVSALFFTGSGFDSAWADEALKRLCTGRRVFRGQNLFVKGAGYAAKLFAAGEEKRYLLIGDRVLKSGISMRVFRDGVFSEHRMAAIGQDYEMAGSDADIIMDDTNELDFIVSSVFHKDPVCAIMTLETLNLRSDRSVRLNVRLTFPDRDTCVITVRDTGFGEIYETDHRIWEQVLKI